MKKSIIILTFLLLLVFYGKSQTTINDSSKVNFYKAYQALQNMLECRDSLNFEKAVFICENAYHNNYFKYEDFKSLLDFHTEMINAYAENVRKQYSEKYKTLNRWEQKYFKSNIDNWAIFKYITDTAFIIINNETYYKKPYSYNYQDPYGSDNWENTQVMSLLMGDKKQGNCYSLAVLFKLFSDRLQSDARLTVTPHHIYIQNRNQKGDFCNVELASKSFPGDGSIQTLTYTTNTSIKNGMAQRMLNDKEAVALNLIYLAKAYQHKYKDNTNKFLLQCAELANKYDSLSLNVLLLKAEVTENRLLAAMKTNRIKTPAKARLHPQTKDLLTNYEAQLNNLYTLGYREVPKDMERIILAAIQQRKEGNILKDKTPNPFASIHSSQRYATLSNGLFDETHEFADTLQYAHVLFNTNTKKIIKILSVETDNDYKVDPVVFALSVDPLSDKYPHISPYAYCAWNPIVLIDPDGRNYTNFLDENGNLISHVEDGSNAVFKLTGTNHTNEYFKFSGFSNQGGSNDINVQGVIAGAQDYVINNYTQCNQAVNFVGRSFESAINATGATAEGINVVNGNKLANPIETGLNNQSMISKYDKTNLDEAKSSAAAGNLLVGTTKGHVTTMTTKDFEITRYDKNGNSSLFQYKGGKIANVNGSTTTGLGPKHNNSYQNPQYAFFNKLYSLNRNSHVFSGGTLPITIIKP